MRRGSPLPIPNREVKSACVNGTAICGRVDRRLSLKSSSVMMRIFFAYKLRQLVLSRPKRRDGRVVRRFSLKSSSRSKKRDGDFFVLY